MNDFTKHQLLPYCESNFFLLEFVFLKKYTVKMITFPFLTSSKISQRFLLVKGSLKNDLFI